MHFVKLVSRMPHPSEKLGSRGMNGGFYGLWIKTNNTAYQLLAGGWQNLLNLINYLINLENKLGLSCAKALFSYGKQQNRKLSITFSQLLHN